MYNESSYSQIGYERKSLYDILIATLEFCEQVREYSVQEYEHDLYQYSVLLFSTLVDLATNNADAAKIDNDLDYMRSMYLNEHFEKTNVSHLLRAEIQAVMQTVIRNKVELSGKVQSIVTDIQNPAPDCDTPRREELYHMMYLFSHLDLSTDAARNVVHDAIEKHYEIEHFRTIVNALISLYLGHRKSIMKSIHEDADVYGFLPLLGMMEAIRSVGRQLHVKERIVSLGDAKRPESYEYDEESYRSVQPALKVPHWFEAHLAQI